jgi:hypothetical protein
MSSIRMATSEAEILEGEAINLSERGISLKFAYKFGMGESLEMYFALPRELTGRRPEEVRCNARVNHIDKAAENNEVSDIGAMIDRFEPLRGRIGKTDSTRAVDFSLTSGPEL